VGIELAEPKEAFKDGPKTNPKRGETVETCTFQIEIESS
jgi:hypothetical protein